MSNGDESVAPEGFVWRCDKHSHQFKNLEDFSDVLCMVEAILTPVEVLS